MTRLTKKMMPEIPHECAKSKAFTMKLADLPSLVDAIFDGDDKMPGWVHMFANVKGCNHVDALFPQACIEWRELPLPGLPDDWADMRVTSGSRLATQQTCRLKVSAGRTIDDSTPDQLALLLAFGVRRDGGRRQSSAKTTAR